ncbi:MAG: S8 family serine peptidase [Verrucomicrobiota bacterium]
MNRNTGIIILGIVFLISIGIALRIGRDRALESDQQVEKPEALAIAEEQLKDSQRQSTQSKKSSSGLSPALVPAGSYSYPSGVIPGEVILHFEDEATLNQAIQQLTEAGVYIRGTISSLGMIRVGLPNDVSPGVLSRILGDRIARQTFNVPVQLPQPINMPEISQYLLPFGDDWLLSIGVNEDNSLWGAGVRIAVIDSGVQSHPALNGAYITRVPMIDEPISSAHGTAVTSLIVGNGDPGFTRGLSPEAEIIAYQALGAEGGDAFTIAQSIVDAVERGASIINLSLGGFGDSPAVREAIAYADTSGVVVVAAVGNERVDQIAYPAAYDEVIGVTAVDMNNVWAEFPNAGLDGNHPDIAGPGVGVTAAGPNEVNLSFSGTSSSTPIVTAAIAAAMSEFDLTAQQAADLVLANANDRGEPGNDAYYGVGYLDVGRFINSDQDGIIDLAVSDHFLDIDGITEDGVPVRVGIQNRGTETVEAPILTVMVGNTANTQEIYLTALLPGESVEHEISIPISDFINPGGAQIGSIIRTEQGDEIRTDNNTLGSRYSLPPEVAIE